MIGARRLGSWKSATQRDGEQVQDDFQIDESREADQSGLTLPLPHRLIFTLITLCFEKSFHHFPRALPLLITE
jgi:hypothetical protein